MSLDRSISDKSSAEIAMLLQKVKAASSETALIPLKMQAPHTIKEMLLTSKFRVNQDLIRDSVWILIELQLWEALREIICLHLSGETETAVRSAILANEKALFFVKACILKHSDFLTTLLGGYGGVEGTRAFLEKLVNTLCKDQDYATLSAVCSDNWFRVLETDNFFSYCEMAFLLTLYEEIKKIDTENAFVRYLTKTQSFLLPEYIEQNDVVRLGVMLATTGEMESPETVQDHLYGLFKQRKIFFGAFVSAAITLDLMPFVNRMQIDDTVGVFPKPVLSSDLLETRLIAISQPKLRYTLTIQWQQNRERIEAEVMRLLLDELSQHPEQAARTDMSLVDVPIQTNKEVLKKMLLALKSNPEKLNTFIPRIFKKAVSKEYLQAAFELNLLEHIDTFINTDRFAKNIRGSWQVELARIICRAAAFRREHSKKKTAKDQIDFLAYTINVKSNGVPLHELSSVLRSGFSTSAVDVIDNEIARLQSELQPGWITANPFLLHASSRSSGEEAGPAYRKSLK